MAFVPDDPREAEVPKSGRFVPDAPPEEKSSFLGKVKGAGEAALSIASSIPAGVAGNVAGAARTLVSGKFGEPEGTSEGGARAKEVTKKFTYEPRSKEGREALEAIGKKLSESKLEGLNPSVPLGAAGGDVLTAIRNRGGKAASVAGKAISETPEADLVRRGAGAMSPEVATDVRALAAKAQELGITLRPDMLTDNKFLRMMGEALENVPLSGSKSEQRQVAFNRALGNLIGADAKANRLTPDVFNKAITASGEKIGEIAKGAIIPLTPELTGALAEQVVNATKFETGDVAKVISNYVKEIRAKAVDMDMGASGAIPGEAFRKINSQIGRQIRNTSNGDLKHALSDLQESLHDALAANLKPAELAALQAARKQYAIAKTLEPLVAKSPRGDMSPAALMAAVTSDKSKKTAMAAGKGGELGDLARIGQMFLKEPGSSGTTERGLAYGIMGGGAVIEPTTAAGVYGAANLYNRVGPTITRRMTKVKDLPAEARETPVRALEAE